MIYLFLIDGFEEIEAIATVDILRRAELPVRTVSLTGSRTVVAAHGVPVVADMMFNDVKSTDSAAWHFGVVNTAEDLLIIPGGTVAYAEHEGLLKAIKAHHDAGGRLAAICAAPAVLGMLGVLRGRRATCYPGYEGYLEGAEVCAGSPVVTDGTITTGRGPGLSLDFALTIVEQLAGAEKRAAVAKALLIN